MPRHKILLNWQVNCDFGWGILGLNVFSHWANDERIMPLSGMPISDDQLGLLDPLRMSSISKAILASNDYLAIARASADAIAYVDGVVIDPISHNQPPSI